MNKNGLVMTQLVKSLSNKMNLQTIDRVQFHPSSITDYMKIFSEYESLGKIKGQFKDRIWSVIHGEFNSTANFDFNTPYSTLNIASKCFVLLTMKENISIKETQTKSSHIKEAIKFTKGFRKDEVHNLEELIATFGIRKKPKFSKNIISFLNFVQVQNSELYIEICSTFTKEIKRTRQIPPIKDVLIFDDIINRFFLEASEDEKLKYYIIILWWRITKIIPMRPIEFFDFKKNCIFKKENNSFWITLPRKKQKPTNNEEVAVTDTLQINSVLYDLINDYKNMAAEYLHSEYLLSYKLYLKHFTFHKKMQHEKVEKSKFKLILKKFYKEIIQERYGVLDLAILKPGDTRHFAFCNMMLQGFNMLSIARIGGHKKLREQLHYFAHLDNYAESSVMILANSYQNKLTKSDTYNLITDSEIRSKIYNKNDYSKLFEVDYGYCTDHPTRCKVNDCRYCEYYLFEPSPEMCNKGLTWLRDQSNILKTRINEQLKYMKYLTIKMEYDLKNLQYPVHRQEVLSTKAKQLQSLIEQKARVDSVLMKEGRTNE